MKNFELMALPYAPEALEPVISAQTLSFHHGKHLAAYVNNLNTLLPGSGMENLSLEEIVCQATGGIQNNAGQILNHELYFGQFAAPKQDNAPSGKMAEAIVRDFGSFEAFKEEFQKKGATLFGSGWVWLSADKDGKLVITQEANAAADLRCVGACLLPRLSEPSPRPSRCAVADRGLESGGGENEE